MKIKGDLLIYFNYNMRCEIKVFVKQITLC